MGSSDSGILYGSSQNLLSGSNSDSTYDPEVTLFVCFPPSEMPVGLTMISTAPKDASQTMFVTVSDISESSAASGLMIKGDTVLSVNDEEPNGAQHASELITAARKGGVECNLKVLRPRSATVTLSRKVSAQPYGLKLGKEGADVLVTGLVAGGLAIKSGQICKGCRIVKINGIAITESETASDVAALLTSGPPSVSLTISHDSLVDVDPIDSVASPA